MVDKRTYVVLRHTIPEHGADGTLPYGLNVFLCNKDGVPIPQRDVVAYHEGEGWVDRFVRDDEGRFIRTADGQGVRVDRFMGNVKATFRDWVA